MCGVVKGGVTPGVWGYEAGQSGVGDIFGWFADHAVPPRYHDEAAREGHRPPRSPLPARRRAGGRRARAGRPGLEQRQPLGARRPRAQRADRRADAEHARRGRLPRADRGDRVRHPQDHRDLRGVRAAGQRADRRRRTAQEPGDHADLRRRHAALAAPDRLRAGPGAGLGDARGGRRRRPPRHLRRGRRDGQGPPRRLHARRGARRTPTTRSTSTTRPCTTTSGAAATTSCTRCATSARARSPVADELADLRREVCALHAELAAPRPGGVDERQPLRARPRRGAHGHQGQRRALRRADARRDRRLRPPRRARRGRPVALQRRRHARLRLPPHRPTSAASRTPTAATPPRGRRAARRSRAC